MSAYFGLLQAKINSSVRICQLLLGPLMFMRLFFGSHSFLFPTACFLVLVGLPPRVFCTIWCCDMHHELLDTCLRNHHARVARICIWTLSTLAFGHLFLWCGRHCRTPNFSVEDGMVARPSKACSDLLATKLDYTNNEKEVPSLKWNSQYKELLIGASQRIGLLGRSYSFNRNVQQRKVYCSFPV